MLELKIITFYNVKKKIISLTTRILNSWQVGKEVPVFELPKLKIKVSVKL